MQLTTTRLLLRDFVATDWPAVLTYQSDPAYLRYYAWESRTAAAVQTFVQRFIEQQTAQPRYKFQLAITLRESGQLIGNCGIRLPEPGATTAEIGYELAPAQWGNGYATEAAQAMITFGFTTLQVHRIAATCVADNRASARVLTKLGLRQEAHLREVAYYKGRWWDEQIYAILQDEWRNQAPASTQFMEAV